MFNKPVLTATKPVECLCMIVIHVWSLSKACRCFDNYKAVGGLWKLNKAVLGTAKLVDLTAKKLVQGMWRLGKPG